MNFKMDLTKQQQNLLQELDIKIEDKNYTQEEIKQCENIITTHIMSKSSKNGDLSNAVNEYSDLINLLMKNE